MEMSGPHEYTKMLKSIEANLNSSDPTDNFKGEYAKHVLEDAIKLADIIEQMIISAPDGSYSNPRKKTRTVSDAAEKTLEKLDEISPQSGYSAMAIVQTLALIWNRGAALLHWYQNNSKYS